jgi:hypothetical protein
MIQDELLAKIDKHYKFEYKPFVKTHELHDDCSNGFGCPPCKTTINYWFTNALRAVVELHKPVQSYMFEEKTCSHCSSEEDRSEILYPCPTIQAIQKELG